MNEEVLPSASGPNGPLPTEVSDPNAVYTQHYVTC